MNRLTSVPSSIEPIIAMASGFCNAEPISEEKSSGTIDTMVVSEVMMMARKRRRPAVWMASISGVPALRSSLMESSFKMESFTTIPHVTMMPIADIRFSVCPNIHSEVNAKAMSIGISTNTMNGCKKLSNCASAENERASLDKAVNVIAVADTHRVFLLCIPVQERLGEAHILGGGEL